MSYFTGGLIYFFPEIFLCIQIAIFIIIGVLLTNFFSFHCLQFIINNLLLNCFYLFFIIYNFNVGGFSLNYLFIFDIWSFGGKLFLCVFFFIFFCLFLAYSEQGKFINFELSLILLLCFLASFCLLSSYDFLSLYLSLELQSLSLYILASSKRFSLFSTDGGIKYFVLGSLASGLLLFGISLLYGILGSLNFFDIAILLLFNISDEYFLFLGISFFFIGCAFIFKLGGFPFYFWVPEIYTKVPSIIMVLFSTIPKFSLLFLFIRFFNLFTTYFFFWQYLFLIAGWCSIFVGVLGAFYQVNIKTLMAFGAINHLGFILVGFGLGTLDGLCASIFYTIVYLFLSFTFFTFLLSIRLTKNLQLQTLIFELNSLYKVYPVFAIFYSLSIFSLAGIPPLAGFFSKFFVFMELISNYGLFFAFSLVGFAIFGVVYYIRLIKIMFFEVPTKYPQLISISNLSSFCMATLSFFNLSFFVFLSPLYVVIQNFILFFYF